MVIALSRRRTTQEQPPAALPSWSVYRQCKDLPLEVFITCIVEGDYTGLIRAGAPSEADLQAAWLDIYSEYCDLIGGANITGMLRQTRQIAQLESRINRVYMLVNCLRVMMGEQTIAELKDAGYTVTWTGDAEAWHRQLDNVIARLNPDVMRLKQLREQQPKDSGKKHTPTREDFQMTLLSISELQKYEVSDQITVHKYCMYVRKLKLHIDNINKLSKKNGTGSTDR